MNVKGKKIFVGLSGGVDSAVSAALLKEQGAEVTGIFIKGWYPPNLICTWAADRRDAMRVAARLSIPFHTLDASAEYKKSVIDYLFAEYREGRTPNPDIMCNRDVKFGAFYKFAKSKGADFIATGHYAQSRDGKLLRGADPEKDQSYFLWAVSREALAKTLFPVGGLPKSFVRALAKRHNLPVAEKRDSQGICFLGAVSVDDFLREEFHPVPGDALDENGKSVGRHDGAVLRTLGERVALSDAPPGPWFVVRKDVAKNFLVVAKERSTPASEEGIRISEPNWLSPLEEGEKIEAQYRYHGPKLTGVFDSAKNSFSPDTALPEPAAAGQSLVLYRDNECIGGGIIS